MLIDLHAHSKAISKCSRINGIDNIELAKSIGLNGFILTNHYDRNYVENNDYMDLAKRYIKEYYDCSACDNCQICFQFFVRKSVFQLFHKN